MFCFGSFYCRPRCCSARACFLLSHQYQVIQKKILTFRFLPNMGRASNASKGLPVKTDAQRAADYRARRRAAGLAEADKERDRQRHREARKRLSHLSSIEKKRKEASRKKACRDLQKAAGSMHENIANPYQTPQTLGKGIARARRALPQCPINDLLLLKPWLRSVV